DLEKANALGIEWMKERLLFKNRTDFRLETALGMLDRFGVVSGSIEQKNLQIVDGLPDLLSDEDYLAEKLQREQKKLYTMVQYAKTTDNRKAFIHNYFGLPFREAA
ncbi:RecQ family zinc-binding domain-containing protein, partial [candidate division KSB1 bacterium]|nr:RecQ family zinc-binding domain-containing protein [candidate division KSB1 bacterium]